MSYTTIPGPETIERTVRALKNHNITSTVVATGADALEALMARIPAGATVTNGSSTTLTEIGFVDVLKEGKHPWKNLHDAVLAESDPARQAVLRNEALFAEYYVGSVHALTETGALVIASASGSQLPHLVFTSPHVILVVGAQKITPTLTDALARVREHVVPLEHTRMQSTGAPGTVLAKTLIIEEEPAFMGRTVEVILVEEALGF